MKVRLLDTGMKSAAENISLDETLLECHERNISPDTIRFLQFSPSCVLVGYHQRVEDEVRVKFCKENNIDINRRITGGGAILFDEKQLGWEIIGKISNFNSRHHRIEKIYEILAEPLCRVLRDYGIDAKFRERNDIEVNGRKISGMGGTRLRSSFLFQGTLLIDFDVMLMLKSLKIPMHKLKDKEVKSFKERITCMKWEVDDLPPVEEIKEKIVREMSKAFGWEIYVGSLNKEEKRILREKMNKFSSPDYIYMNRKIQSSNLYGIYKGDGGIIRTNLVVRGGIIQSIIIHGDFFVYPRRAIQDLEAYLKFTPARERVVRKRMRDFFDRDVEIQGLDHNDFSNAICETLKKLKFKRLGLNDYEINHIFEVGSGFEKFKEISHVLLPYCAKKLDCKYRYDERCIACGKCDIGILWKESLKLGLKPITIISYEHLEDTLESLKRKGAKAFLGTCCEIFYIKHKVDFERIGLPGILIDINSTSCYDVGEEDDAYAGKYERQSSLMTDLVLKIMKKWGEICGI